MSKSAVELPETLEPGDGPEKPVNVDDLLAQMAGDEIDRLLSESEDGAPKPATPPPAPPKPVAEDGVAKQLDELFSGSDAPVAEEPHPNQEQPPAQLIKHDVEIATPAAGTVIAAAPEAAPVGRVGDKFEETKREVAGGIVIRDEPATQTDARKSTDDIQDAEIEERAALDAPLDENDLADNDALTSDDDETVPLLLKPLALMNSPLENSPDWIRDLIGKIALLTLFNAAAVLLYILLFRHHH